MAQQLAWKYWMVWRDDLGRIEKVYIKLWLGEVTTEDEADGLTGAIVPVTRFRHQERLTGARIPPRYRSVVEKTDDAGQDVLVLHLVPWVDANGIHHDPNLPFVVYTTDDLTQRIIDWIQ